MCRLLFIFLPGTRLLATENFTSHGNLSSSTQAMPSIHLVLKLSLLLLRKLVWVVTALRNCYYDTILTILLYFNDHLTL